jgi:hypothetical protein
MTNLGASYACVKILLLVALATPKLVISNL